MARRRGFLGGRSYASYSIVCVLLTLGLGAACDLLFGPGPADSTVRIVVEEGSAFLSGVEFVSDELFVQIIPGSLEDADSLAASVGAQVLDFEAKTQTARLRVGAGDLDSTASRLASFPEVEGVEKNYWLPLAAVPSDPSFIDQWYLTQVGLNSAWDVTVGQDSQIIAIVDSGVDINHPDLRDRLIAGYDFVNNTTDANDCCGHGTAVAGVAAAVSNNGVGIAGATWGGAILPIRVAALKNGAVKAKVSDIAKGIIWAADRGASVINVSFSGVLSSRTIQNACQYAVQSGVPVVAAMGNGGVWDAAPNSPWTISVGATDAAKALADFSTFGPGVDLVAPGVALLTTARSGGYALASGTSFSSPLVSGVVALMRAVRPNATPTDIADLLLASTDDLGATGFDESFGHGLVDASSAVQSAQAASIASDTTPPTVAFANPPSTLQLGSSARLDFDARDNSLIRHVSLSIDGVEVARDVTAPYAMLLASRSTQTGVHRLSTRAVDFAGNVSAEAAINVTFEQDPFASTPEVEITSPQPDAAVQGTIVVTALLRDSTGLQSVALLLDGEILASGQVSGRSVNVEFTWNASSNAVRAGRHILGVKAVSAQNFTAMETITITTE